MWELQQLACGGLQAQAANQDRQISEVRGTWNWAKLFHDSKYARPSCLKFDPSLSTSLLKSI